MVKKQIDRNSKEYIKSKVRFNSVSSIVLGSIFFALGISDPDTPLAGLSVFFGILLAIMGLANIFRAESIAEKKFNKLNK